LISSEFIYNPTETIERRKVSIKKAKVALYLKFFITELKNPVKFLFLKIIERNLRNNRSPMVSKNISKISVELETILSVSKPIT
jgi:hypothetical protein